MEEGGGIIGELSWEKALLPTLGNFHFFKWHLCLKTKLSLSISVYYFLDFPEI
jgi:hypothetical protein